MTSSIPIRSLMTTLTYTVLILTLAGCGPGFDDGSGADRSPREPSEIEIRYREMQAERQERLRTHTGEGPVFTDEELAEFKRMEQRYHEQLEAEKKQRQEEAKQSRLRTRYAACEAGDRAYCRGVFKAKVEKQDGDDKRKTIQTTANLPNTIIAEYYFGLQGAGCTSEDPVNTWTDVDTVTIQYTGDGDVVPERHIRSGEMWGVRRAECEVNIVLRTPDILLEIPEDVEFKFEVEPSVEDVRVACSQEEPYKCGKWLELKAGFYPPPTVSQDARWIVRIENILPSNLSYESYFDVTGTGCYTDNKIKEWTGDNIVQIMSFKGYVHSGIVIKHRGNWVDPGKTEDFVEAECKISAQVRVAGERPVFIPQFKGDTWGYVTLETPGTVIVPFTIKPE